MQPVRHISTTTSRVTPAVRPGPALASVRVAAMSTQSTESASEKPRPPRQDTKKKGSHQNKSDSSGEGASGSSMRNSFILSLLGMWSATLRCLSNAAVSLEGDLEGPRIDIDRVLRRHEKTTHPPLSSGIVRYDTVHLASNEPVEDEHREAVISVPSGHWSFFGIFDGHNGSDTSKWLADHLVLAVSGALGDLYSSLAETDSSTSPKPSPASISQTVKKTFLEVDDEIVNERTQSALSSTSRVQSTGLIGPANAGSCALLAFYDSDSRRLHVALTGDSRAVLGRRHVHEDGEVNYDVYILTTEQNSNHPDELARLNEEHPGEALIEDDRIFGMAVTRAFGDARFKWSRDVQQKLHRRNLARQPIDEVKTPPYITAEPDVTSMEVQPGDFLIMATDGLWESLTSEEAVGLVGLWKEGQQTGFSKREPVGGYSPHALPVWLTERDTTLRYRQWNVDKRFVREDRNAATHLLRNALAGADRDMASTLLAMRSPKARAFRDDMTVLVVFFADGNDPSGGGL